MRTTISIDDQILEELKRLATERGTTVSQLIEESVRLARIRREPTGKRGFKLVTYGRGGRFTHLDLNRMSTVVDEEDTYRAGQGRH